jgi:hypothetical protein
MNGHTGIDRRVFPSRLPRQYNRIGRIGGSQDGPEMKGPRRMPDGRVVGSLQNCSTLSEIRHAFAYVNARQDNVYHAACEPPDRHRFGALRRWSSRPPLIAMSTRHLLDACSRYFLCFSLWRRPPTGHATLCNDPAPVFQGGALCVRIGLFAKARVRVHAHGGRLHATGGGHPEPCFAVAFPSDGEGMVRPSGSRTECGYPDGTRTPRLRVETTGLPGPRENFATVIASGGANSR